MDSKKLKAKILEWLCKKFGIVSIGLKNGMLSYTISNGKSKKSYYFLKNSKSDNISNSNFYFSEFIFAYEHLDKLNISNAYETKFLKPWQILDVFLDESKKGYSIYVLWRNYSFKNEFEKKTEFIERNSSLETLAIEMDLDS